MSYKIFIKENDKLLKLKKIRCELDTSNTNNVLYFEILIPSEQDKIIHIKTSSIDILKVDYPRNVQIGVGQYHNYEYKLEKLDKDVNVDSIQLRFVLREENDSILSKSLISTGNLIIKCILFEGFNTNLMESVYLNSSKIDSKTNTESTSSNKAEDIDHNLVTTDHEFIYKIYSEEEEVLSKNYNVLNIKLNKIENDSVTCNFLIKFNESGDYAMRLEVEYKVLKTDIYDDYYIMKYFGTITFQVIEPFSVKYEYIF